MVSDIYLKNKFIRDFESAIVDEGRKDVKRAIYKPSGSEQVKQ